ncbi:MAG: LysM peptidoglycan-binding domain-containing protein [Planctomycetota bacterium]
MGKTEKIVVLSVLLSVVLLFVWSLQGTGPKAQAGGDASSAAGSPETTGEQAEGARPLPRPENRSPEQRGPDLTSREDGDASVADAERLTLSEGPKMLMSEVNPNAAPAEALEPPIEPADVRMKSGWDLLSTKGLEPTVDPGMLTMRPKDGATWDSLAFDLYGDESKAALLRHHNEGMAVPGAMIFVPVKDDVGEAVDAQVVEVLAGESLWGVAARTLGDGARWREIFEANQDVLTDPDFVAPGTRLKIPAAR